MYELVIFDMAGTTVRDPGNVADSFMHAFRENGIDIPREEVKKVMGFRKKDAIRMLLDKYPLTTQGNTDELIGKIHDVFIHTMISFYENDYELSALPHAEEIFAQLNEQGILVALNTGFTRAIADTILNRLQWNDNRNI